MKTEATAYIEELKAEIRRLYGVECGHVESVPVKEVRQAMTVWEGTVEVFDLKDHPTAPRAYAWARDSGEEGVAPRRVVMLHRNRIKGAQDAVRASIVQEFMSVDTDEGG